MLNRSKRPFGSEARISIADDFDPQQLHSSQDMLQPGGNK